MNPHLRIARPTDRLDEIATMYREGLGLEDLGGFEGPDGFDGAIVGARGRMASGVHSSPRPCSYPLPH